VDGLFLFSSGTAQALQSHARVAQQHGGSVPGAIVPYRQPNTVCCATLSAEFITYLSELAAKGVTVRMVTAKNVPSGTGLTVGAVKPEQISSDGVLIDGCSWYEIGTDSRIQ
jgi:hypothetical protein